MICVRHIWVDVASFNNKDDDDDAPDGNNDKCCHKPVEFMAFAQDESSFWLPLPGVNYSSRLLLLQGADAHEVNLIDCQDASHDGDHMIDEGLSGEPNDQCVEMRIEN